MKKSKRKTISVIEAMQPYMKLYNACIFRIEEILLKEIQKDNDTGKEKT